MARNDFQAAASDFYETLANLSAAQPVRRRYATLQAVLTQAAEQRLLGVEVMFTGLFSKLDFLYKTYRGEHADGTLWHAVNEARRRFRETEVTEDGALEAAWPHDLKAVCLFIALIYAADPPERLARHFPETPFRPYRKRVRDGEDRPADSIKCSVNSWDDRYIYVTREDTGGEAAVAYAGEGVSSGNWDYLRPLLAEKAQIALVWPREEAGRLYPELIILHPDLLVDVTAVAGCFTECGVSAYTHLLSLIKPNPANRHTLLGNFAGQLLDEATYGRDIPYAESVREFFRHNALNFAVCQDIGEDFHAAAQAQRENIRHIIGAVYPRTVKSDFRSDEVILEPSFLSPTLGLQGRMDFLDLNYRVVIEQKSGKGAFRPGTAAERFAGAQTKHQVQVLLYRAVLHYGYAHTRYEQMHAFLLYSRYRDGLADTASMPQLLFEAFRIRNQIAGLERLFATKGFQVLESLTPRKIYPSAQGVLWEKYVQPQLGELLAPLQSASALEKAYFHRFMRFIATERQLSKVGNRTKENSGFAAVWCGTLEEKRGAGDICEGMSLEPVLEGEGLPVKDIRLTLPAGEDTAGSNFRTGDIVMCYPYRPGSLPDATKTMVLRCTLTGLSANTLTLRLRNPQTTTRVFAHFAHSLWAVEHDFVEASYTALYRGMYAFLSAPKERRDLLLGRRRPTADSSRQLCGDYGADYFNELARRVKQADDFYLVIGPPGTGKTSYGLVNVLREELLSNNGGAVLLLSYTNRAVDEICDKLSGMNGGDGKPLPYIRIGNDFGCAPPFRPRLLSNLSAQCRNVAEVRELIRGTRVFCGTTTALSSNISLLEIKTFSLAIVDEASQILEPHLMGLLSARNDSGTAIRKFVLIGDEKQLPAVVQQSEEQSRVKEAELNAAGLTDCRLSLFERLLRLYGYGSDGRLNADCCHLLSQQGRMHPEIAAFPNETFYQNALRAVPLAHQREKTPPCGEGQDGLCDLLATRRVAFIDCPPQADEEAGDKVNTAEAEVAAAVVAAVRRRCGEKFDPFRSVGVIVPYRNQIAAVRCAVERYGLPELKEISIDTVERYQGGQRDVVVYAFTAKKYYQLSFLTANEYTDQRDGAVIDRKLNVAMTRARRCLVLTGNAALLAHDLTFYKLLAYLRTRESYFRLSGEFFVNGKFPVPPRFARPKDGTERDVLSLAADVFPPRLLEAFAEAVVTPLRADPRSQWPKRPLGNCHHVNLSLLSFGRCAFSRPLSLYAAAETGERLTLSPEDQARLYAFYSLPPHFKEAAALYTENRAAVERLLGETSGRVCLVDVGCGPGTGGWAFFSVFGETTARAAYWGVDRAEAMRGLAERLLPAALAAENCRRFAKLPGAAESCWESLAESPTLVIFHFSGFFGCVTPRHAEQLTHIISGVIQRYRDNRYALAVCQSACEASLRPWAVARRWAAENALPLWERVWDDSACPLS